MKYLQIFAFLALSVLTTNVSLAQGMAINESGTSANSSAMLDVSSTSKGLLMPRMLASQRLLISSPATGLLVYQTDGTAGYYYYTGSAWINLGAAEQMHKQVFTSSGLFITSANTTTNTLFKVTVTGGGGGGGGYNSTTYGINGGGGGGGSTSITWVSGLSSSTGYTASVGAGGAGGAINGNGATGGNSYFIAGSATVTAIGGGGGLQGGYSPSGGSGGSVASATIGMSGGNGYEYTDATGYAWGGSSYWGPTGVGNATNYGSGGGGSAYSGGYSGKAGIILIEWVE